MNRERSLRLYITGVGLLAIAVLLTSAYFMAPVWSNNLTRWEATAPLFVLLGWLLCRQQVYTGDTSSVTLSSIGQVATLLILPPSIAIVVIGIAKLLSELSLYLQKQRKSRRAVVVNASSSVLASAAGLGAFYLLHGDQYVWTGNFRPLLALPALLVFALAYHLTSTLVVVIAITLNSGERPLSIFAQLTKDTIGPELSLIAVGIVSATLWHFSPILSLFVAVPMYLSMQSFASVARLRKETVEAVLKMAGSIDYRDTGTYEHSQRLADMSRQLASNLGLTPEHVQDVVLASRVHDLGKIGISNDILLKQGPLTPEERSAMQEHPVIGASILSSYSAFKGSVDIVKYHHERWDGRGYPEGLSGAAIPLGSRIISVVDAFDSMTADRPYRKGMTVDDAVERLKDGIGSQFDPTICATFIQLLIEEGIYLPHERTPELRLVAADAS